MELALFPSDCVLSAPSFDDGEDEYERLDLLEKIDETKRTGGFPTSAGDGSVLLSENGF